MDPIRVEFVRKAMEVINGKWSKLSCDLHNKTFTSRAQLLEHVNGKHILDLFHWTHGEVMWKELFPVEVSEKGLALHKVQPPGFQLNPKQSYWFDRGVLDVHNILDDAQLEWLSHGLGYAAIDHTEFKVLERNTRADLRNLFPEEMLPKTMPIQLPLRPKLPPYAVVKKADKGSTIVVMKKEYYDEMMTKHVRKEGYIATDNSGICDFESEAMAMVESMTSKTVSFAGKIRKLVREGCDRRQRERCLYVLPKLHKALDKDGMMPPRPIVDGVGNYAEPLDKWLAKMLGPYLPKLTTVCLNSMAAIKTINEFYANRKTETLPFCQTCDITNMYGNLAPQLVEKEVRKFLSLAKAPNETKIWVPKLVGLLLKYNIFKVGEIWYQQTGGIAMGLSVSPILANIVMYMLEKGAVSKSGVAVYQRYIDDLLILDEDSEKINGLVDKLNGLRSEIKLTWDGIPSQERTFLDLSIKLEKEHPVLDVYFKPTDSLSMIHRNSQHCPGTFRGIIYGQLMRFMRNANNLKAYEKAWCSLWLALTKQGYQIAEYAKFSKEVINVCKQKVWPYVKDKGATGQDKLQTDTWVPLYYHNGLRNVIKWARVKLRTIKKRISFRVCKTIRRRIVRTRT